MRGVGTLGNRYRLVDRLGAGGMGVVWRAYDEVLDRQVAVKVLAPEYSGDADSRRVLAEARAAGRLAHPHIASVYDYGESLTAEGIRVPYVVMELLKGRSLDQRLKRAPLAVDMALRICAQVASALAAAHAQGLVHRDVKPANVMLTAGGAKVVDFGLAAAAGDLDHADGAKVMGTPAYLAPERLSGHPVVAATDVYALGLLLYRLLAGRLPWTAETSTQMLEAHVYLEPMPLPKIAGVPPVVRELVHRCLAKVPDERPASRDVTVTLARAAGIRVPLDGVDDDLDDVSTGDQRASVDRHRRATSQEQGVVRPVAPTPPPGALSAADPYVERLAKYLDGSLDHVNLRRQASLLLHGAVGFDLAIWAVLDPSTLMWASCVIDGGPHDERFEHELFANEYGQDDVLRLVDLAQGPYVGTLHARTNGDPATSRRYRNILQPRGFADELRLMFHDPAGTWGALMLYRTGGRFGDADVARLAPASRPFGEVLHRALVRQTTVAVAPKVDTPVAAPPTAPGAGTSRVPRRRLPLVRRDPARPADRSPVTVEPPTPPQPPVSGTLTLSHDGRLLDVTAAARVLLDAAELDRVGTAVARGRLSGLIDASSTARQDGRWLAFHAMRGTDSIAVTVQRIHPGQVSEFVVRARGLGHTHWRLLGAVARGRNTRQIAQDLELSVYAVQDGMNALFTAFGVGGRIELVKTLFFDHYVPLHAADAVVTRDG